MDGPAQDLDPQPDANLDHGRRARFERSRTGQTIITYALLVALAALVVQNLPASVVRRDLGSLDSGAHRLGYDQDWSVFAPDPRPENLRVYATLTYPDGSTRRWDMPKGNPWLNAYSDFRWQKYQERVRADSYSGLWQPLSQWLAANQTKSGEHPVKVVLSRRFRAVTPIGQPATVPPPAWTTQVIFTYRPAKR